MIPGHDYDYPTLPELDDDDLRIPRLDSLPPLPPISTNTPPNLEVYSYLGVSYYADQKAINRGERFYEKHIDDVQDQEIDGCDPPAPFCGCSTCFDRATIGFWMSYIVQAIRAGYISIDEPPPDSDPA